MVSEHLLQGLVFGFCVALPIGPVSLMCIQRCLSDGVALAAACGLGAASVHGVLAALTGAGAGLLVQAQSDMSAAARVVSALALAVIGLRAIFSHAPAGAATRGNGIAAAYVSSLMVTGTNPMTLLPYVAAASALSAGAVAGTLTVSLWTLGIVVGTAACYALLIAATRLTCRRAAPETMARLNIAAGVMMVGCATAVAVGVV